MRLLMPNVTYAPATRVRRVDLCHPERSEKSAINLCHPEHGEGSAFAFATGETRRSLAVDDRLYFAQVREDPQLELDGLDVGPNDSVVVVSSGGCTALSLLAAGAGRVTAVDMNRTQNHLIELKLAAIAVLSRTETLSFLGATGGTPIERIDAYAALRPRLTPKACAYWDSHLLAVAGGVLGAGVTERFIRTLIAALRLFVHPRSRIERMLACESLLDQRVMFVSEWNTVRWRAYFRVLLNRAMFRRTYDPAFFAHLERPSFAEHFRRSAEHALTELPVRDNYFLHHMLTGRYPVDVPGGVPPYLSDAGYETSAAARDQFTLADGTMTEYLRSLPDRSVSVFSLSNICEWLAPADIEALFAEIVRTATPNARLCFRNFVGWTEVPERFRDVIVEDKAWGDRNTPRDRSVVLRRAALCRIYV
jgi:S-adenosylmethionine-diacylglycerol 3-amino-3-carboxypropyl transferase